MTATNFRDLLAGWLSGDPRFGPVPGDYSDADEILALPVPWVDCPTCCQAPHPRKRGCKFTPRNMMVGWSPCPACHGTGKATVAQLLAWGQAAAQPITDWGNYHLGFGDPAVDAVEDWRNRILDTRP